MAVTRTRYARSGDVDIAYQVIGDGPRDIVVAFDWASHLETMMELPVLEEFVLALGRMGRVLVFDMRGLGMSSPVAGGVAPIETWTEDLFAVMAAVGSTRATIVAQGFAAQMALLAAAARPDTVASLVIVNGFARMSRAEDYPAGMPSEVHERLLDEVEAQWGSGELARILFPMASTGPGFVEWWGRLERFGATPRVARARMESVLELDVRHVLPLVDVPTLVVASSGNRLVRVDHGHYLAEHIPAAKLLVLDSPDHFPPGDAVLLGAIAEFVTGSRHDEAAAERTLATVMFVDVVGSTARISELGNERWGRLLDHLEQAADAAVGLAGGRLERPTGDGILSTFAGPARAIRCAQHIRDEVRRVGLEVRCGLHTGEIAWRANDIAGLAVHIGARVCAAAAPGEVLVTRTVRDLVAGSGIAFEERGEHELKGVPDTWALYAASG